MRYITRITKIVSMIGSLLFLVGSILYITKYDNIGLYVYFCCAICFVVASIIDIIEFECKK